MFAPPDRHLLVEADRVDVKHGPRENRFRPSIDALLRSAAQTRKERVIGTVLAGLLNDGTSGLWSITRLNGTTIVQDPGEADIDSMPLGARAGADRPHPARGRDGAARWAGGPRTAEQRRLSAAGIGRTEGGRDGSCRFSEPVPSRDHALRRAHRSHPPGGRGALVRTREGASARFRCHAGHGFTADAFLFGITRTAEEALWGATRASGDGVDAAGRHG
ncbi:hypothetical protein MOTC310_14040 [Methylobacterium oryzae]|uniref:protein-glutamate methylesterase n=1 Tax=Methylobacterium oryzae TaxID=334852 RepID=A0ABU7TPV4_9HYPH